MGEHMEGIYLLDYADGNGVSPVWISDTYASLSVILMYYDTIWLAGC